MSREEGEERNGGGGAHHHHPTEGAGERMVAGLLTCLFSFLVDQRSGAAAERDAARAGNGPGG
nr:unnamed protein product [Digitaria exilis]